MYHWYPLFWVCFLAHKWRKNLRRAMTISDGELSALVSSPLAIGLWSMAIIGFILPMILGRFVRASALKKEQTQHSEGAS